MTSLYFQLQSFTMAHCTLRRLVVAPRKLGLLTYNREAPELRPLLEHAWFDELLVWASDIDEVSRIKVRNSFVK